jgi:hypothetical protein
MKKLFLTIPLIFTLINTHSQQKDKQKSHLKISGHYVHGIIMPHHSHIAYMIKDYSRGAELTITRKTDGSKRWHELYGYPEIGINLYFTGTGNSDVYGYITSAAAYASFNIFDTKYYNLRTNTSIGLAFASKKWNITSNKENLAIGTTVNAYLMFGIYNSFRITKKTDIVAGIQFRHASNGKTKSPNSGLNFVTTSIGVKHMFGDYNRYNPSSDRYNFSKNEYSFILAAGLKNPHRWIDKKSLITTLETNYLRQINEKELWGGGTDIFYDSSITTEQEDKRVKKEFDKTISIGIHATYELCMGKVRFSFQQGIYVFDKYKEKGLLYNRLAIRYPVNKYLITKIALKSHYAKADYIEWGIGYRFN